MQAVSGRFYGRDGEYALICMPLYVCPYMYALICMQAVSGPFYGRDGKREPAIASGKAGPGGL
jgi:hypothetical protein